MFDHVIFLNTTSFIVLQVIGSVKHLFMASKIIVFILDWLRRVFVVIGRYCHHYLFDGELLWFHVVTI